MPIFKKNSKLDCSNNQPISLLSNVEEILQKPMYKRVYNFQTESNFIYDLQFGFGQKFCSFHALINLTEKVMQALDERYVRCGIFVDLQNTFDKMGRELLLSKLDHCGIRSISNNGSNPTFLIANNLFL